MIPTTYIPSSVKVSLFGIPVSGFSNSNIVSIERIDNATTFRKAMDGSQTAFMDKYGSYRVTIHLNQTSESNTWLHLLFKLYLRVGVEFKMPLMIEEKIPNGGSTFTSLDTFFETEPNTIFNSSLETKPWVFICNNASYVQQGTQTSNELIEAIQLIIRAIELSQNFGFDLSDMQDSLVNSIETSMDALKNFI